ncbi:hypothetical protein M0812_19921 [Anaeramoeba flamelloides]|uniref:GAF domain-containing protein n=1 Tax=Anaeramoeba flamelloides TaxID=1746091 RepID=A0AAV7YVP3_9EUKA|nr:hypothetical protein M0812_19921 [Anaeramoeba flamelloides]
MGNSGIGQTFLPPENVDLCTVKKYSKIIADNSEAICIMNQKSEILDCNLSFANYLGFNDLDTFKIAVFNFINICSDEQENTQKSIEDEVRRKIGECIGGGGCDFRWKLRNFDNVIIKSHVWFKPVRLKSGLMIQGLVRNIDISNTKVKSINKSLTTDTSLTSREIADWCIEEGVRITHSTIGYLAFVSKDQSKINLYGWSNSAMQNCSMINRPIIYDTVKTGLWGEALRQRKAVVTNDYVNATKYKKGHPKGHVKIIRHMNIPVFYNPDKGNVKKNRVVLIAGVGNKPKPYTKKDIVALEKLMNRMWKIFKQKFKI